jgi:iron complex outermembrane receptor protein
MSFKIILRAMMASLKAIVVHPEKKCKTIGKTSTFITAGLCLIYNLSVAQSTLNGRVIDSEDKSPLAGVNIILKTTQKGTTTDAEGKFSLALTEGISEIIVSYLGFKSQTIRITDASQFLEIALEADNFTLNEIIVTGFENNRSLLESTGAIAVAGVRDFERADKSSLTQMINQIPGVQARGSNILRPATIAIRGMGARGPGQTGRIKIYLNDLMLTNADGTNAWEDIDPYTIGSVEVIKGPGSSIYGASVGGVLNINTQKSSYNENSLEAFTMLGSFNTLRYGSTYRIGTENLNLMATVGTQSTDGFRDHSQEQRDFATLLATFRSSEQTSTTIFFNRNRYDSRAPGSLTPEQVADNPRQALPIAVQNNAGRDITFTRIGISNDWEIGEKWRNITSLTTAFSDLDHPINFLYIYQWTQNAGARTRFIHENTLFGKKIFLTLGGEYQVGVVKTNFYGIANARPNGVRVGDREAKVKNGIAFGQVEFEASDKLLITAGASANFYEYGNLELTLADAERQQRKFDPFFAPRIAFNYRPIKNVAFHGNVSRGFTPPATGDINRPDGTINLDLKPESAFNYEIGSRGQILNGYLEFDVSFYRINLMDEILTRTPEIGFAIRENAGQTSYTGAEIYLRSNLIKGKKGFFTSISPSFSYTYQETVFRDFVESFAVGGNIIVTDLEGQFVPGNAPNRIFSNLELITRPGFYAFANLEWVDTTPINNSNTLSNPAFTFLGAKIGWRGKLGNRFEMNVYGGGNNLLDEIYSDAPALNPNPIPAGPLAGQVPYLNLNWGRNFYGGIDLKFFFN